MPAPLAGAAAGAAAKGAAAKGAAAKGAAGQAGAAGHGGQAAGAGGGTGQAAGAGRRPGAPGGGQQARREGGGGHHQGQRSPWDGLGQQQPGERDEQPGNRSREQLRLRLGWEWSEKLLRGRLLRRLALLVAGFVAFLVILMAILALVLDLVVDTVTSSLPDGARGLPTGAGPFLEIYRDAANVFGVNPYLLMAVHEDESHFGTSPQPGVRSGVNFANCCAGPMQFLIAGGALPKVGGTGGTWAAYDDAFKAAKLSRPANYPNEFGPHPNVYDSYDSIYAAAKYFKEHGAGAKLDQRTFDALTRYKGTPPGSIPFAKHDYDRARELQRMAAGTTAGGAPLERVVGEANAIEAMRLPYCWAGGHAPEPGPSYIALDCWRAGQLQRRRTFSDTGLDCSGSVRWLLVRAGFPDPGPMHSSEFATKYPKGEGEHVTIWSTDGHVFVTIDGRAWGTSTSNHAHGPGWASHPTAGFTPSHPPGL